MPRLPAPPFGMSRGLVLAAGLTLIVGCAPAADGRGDARLRVVATTTILADWVRNVGGERVQTDSLLAPGEDAHAFEPIPSDARRLSDADLILAFGFGLEPWLADLHAASGSSVPLVEVSEGLEARPAAEEEGEHGALDPHVWFDVRRAMAAVERVRDALTEVDPPGETTYRANAEAYIAELEALDEWIVEQVATLPVERRKLVTSHDTFAYFAERYGFVVVGSLLPTSTEAASPSAQDILRLAEAIRREGVPAVFPENVTTGSLLNQVAEEAGVEVVGPLYTDALGPAGSPADTYLGLMHFDVETIVAALRP
jgi:ABC-type Zn uptake system ZnuABC Zn-binding protein ZnuA